MATYRRFYLVTDATGAVLGTIGRTVQIPVTFPLEDKATYSWDVRAVDTENAASSWT